MKTIAISVLFFLFFPIVVFPQEPDKTVDTFKQAIKKELPGKLEKQIAKKNDEPEEQRNPFLIHTGKIIRSIRTKTLGFESKINDSANYSGFVVTVANALHTNTKQKIITNNLLFKEGDKINPYLLADNERYLRNLDFIQDAVIVVQSIPGITDSADLLILVKDGFSIVPGVGAGGLKKYNAEIKEENFAGTGTSVAISSFYDDDRTPRFGYGGDFLRRNVKGSFINWGLGARDYKNAFNDNNNSETIYYLKIEKPLASQYLRWMGNLDISYNKSSNGYYPDSLNALYLHDFRYSFYIIDGWAAYNFNTGKLKYENLKSTIRKFVGLRIFHQHFTAVPEKYRIDYDGTYSGITGVLVNFSLFQQNFFRTTYIYGFGRNEDVPQGFTASIIGGYTVRKDSLYQTSRTRPYYGLEGMSGKYNRKGFYSSYTFRLGSYYYRGGFEDFDVLLSADHFTQLKKINSKWYRRYFLSGSITKQFLPVLEQALILRSPFGLPYFEYGYINADLRIITKTEAVFYQTKKFFGFGFAPFGFVDMALLKPTKQSFSKTDFYSAIGTGFRFRNENLLLGTIEARISYYPRIVPGMSNFSIKFDTNLRYKYNSSFIRRPDFVSPNL